MITAETMLCGLLGGAIGGMVCVAAMILLDRRLRR